MDREKEFDFDQVNDALFDFLDRTPNAFYAVENMRQILTEHEYTPLREQDSWHLEEGGKYFVTRNDSALIAFRIPKDASGFHIVATHGDSPAFKIKTHAEITADNSYVKLNTEKYGGMLMSTWMDRPLSVAGRVASETPNGIETRLVNIDKDLVMIPSLAIHINREANTGYTFHAQSELPLFGQIESKDGFLELVAEAAGVRQEDILDTDLFLYNRMKAVKYGAQEAYIASGRLDDLQCAFASLQGFLYAEPKQIAVHALLDNEEVGSGTKQGASGTFLSDVLHRIAASSGKETDYLRMVSESFMVSADNAHAVHPNHMETSDPTNRPHLNGGIVIKYNANQKYTSDAVSAALFRSICKQAKVPVQTFVNHSDQAGGSTLGNLSQAQVSLNSVDIGLPQLAMHSAYETAGAKDTAYLIEALREFYSCKIRRDGNRGERYQICSES